MGIILYIGKNKDITDNIAETTLINHEVTILNCNYYYKHYIEEYMPARYRSIRQCPANKRTDIIRSNKRDS